MRERGGWKEGEGERGLEGRGGWREGGGVQPPSHFVLLRAFSLGVL